MIEVDIPATDGSTYMRWVPDVESTFGTRRRDRRKQRERDISLVSGYQQLGS